jgi:hypothetical protein
MSRSSASKAAAKKTRTTHRSRVGAKKAHTSQVAAEKTSNTHRKEAPKVAAETVRDTHRKVEAKFQEFRAQQGPDVTPAVVERSVIPLNEFRATAVPYSMPASAKGSFDRQIEDLQTQVPASMRALAEMYVAQMRALYQRSASAFEATFESWEDALDAAGQGAVALNRKVMDIAQRNISTGFDFATRLAGARNLADVMEMQAVYWHKQFGELRMQAEEVRTLLEKVTDSAAEPFKRS